MTALHSLRSREGISEVIPALGLSALGTYMLLDARGIKIPAGEHSIGPRFFPYVVGGAMVVVGLLLAVAVLRGDRGQSEEGEDVEVGATTDWRTLGTIAGTMIGYILILEPVGYLLSTMLLFAGTAWSLGSRNARALVFFSIVVPFATYMLFTRALGVYLPNGILQAVI